jgi:hypothetical protein
MMVAKSSGAPTPPSRTSSVRASSFELPKRTRGLPGGEDRDGNYRQHREARLFVHEADGRDNQRAIDCHAAEWHA